MRALPGESVTGEKAHDGGMRRRRREVGSLADCGLADGRLVAGEGGGIALVVFGPSLDALDGTNIGEGRRFSKLNRLTSAPALTGLKTGVSFSRNFL